jgi:hypothetical protein
MEAKDLDRISNDVDLTIPVSTKLAARVREEEWSHEPSSTRCSRPRSPRASATAVRAGSRPPASPPARRSRSSTSPSSARSSDKWSSAWASSTFSTHARTSSCSVRPAPARATWRSRSGSGPAWPLSGSPSRPRPSGWHGLATPNPGQARGRATPTRLRAAHGRRRGGLHPGRPRGRQPDVLARLRPLPARLCDRHLEQALLRLRRDLRRRGRRLRDDRPARPPRRDPRSQGRQLPAARQGPRLATTPN